MIVYNRSISFGLETSIFHETFKGIQGNVTKGTSRVCSYLPEQTDNSINKLHYLRDTLIHEYFLNNQRDLKNLVLFFILRLKKNPFDYDLTIGLGNALKQLGQVNRVKRLYSRFNKNKPRAEIIFISLANIFFEEGSYSKARIYYEKALSLNYMPPKGPIYVKLVYCCHNLKEFDLASNFAELALLEGISNTTPELCLLFGNIYLGAKRYKKAIENYESGIRHINNYSLAIRDFIAPSGGQHGNKVKSFLSALKLISPRTLEPKLLTNLGNALNQMGEYELAKVHLKKAISLVELPYAYNNLALSLKAQGDLDGALFNLSKAAQMLPDSDLISLNLAETHLAKGDESKAIAFFKKVVQKDKTNESAKFKLNALLGKKTLSAPKKYVANLFDKYSETFDRHLLNSLAYKVPKEIWEVINKKYQKSYRFDKALDLGCGTGLCGINLGNRCEELVGIDLSKSMLTKAKEKGIYNKLKHLDIIDYLVNTKLEYELILAGDVLIYLGELDKLFQYSHGATKKNGRFIFSIELSYERDFLLTKSGRFAHSISYVKKTANQYLWQVETEKSINIRYENNTYVKGVLFTLVKR